MSQENGSSCCSVGAFIIGAVIGGLLAYIYTPSTGNETRDKLKYEAQNKLSILLNSAKSSLDKLSSKINDMTNVGAGVLIEDEIL